MKNPPAYPTSKNPLYATSDKDNSITILEHPGMSLLDYYAGLAMQGFLASGVDHYDGLGDTERYAKTAYNYARAMLEERAKPENQL